MSRGPMQVTIEGKEYTANTLEALATIAESFNCDLYKGQSNELLIDVDKDVDETLNRDVLKIIDEKFVVVSQTWWTSRSGGRHIVIKLLKDLPPVERIALQAVLGSDPKREAIAIWEYVVLGTDTISFFKPKDAVAHTFPNELSTKVTEGGR